MHNAQGQSSVILLWEKPEVKFLLKSPTDATTTAVKVTEVFKTRVVVVVVRVPSQGGNKRRLLSVQNFPAEYARNM